MLYKYLLELSFFVPKRLRILIINLVVKREGGEMFSATLREIFKKEHNISVGYGSYGGCFNANNIPPNVIFGNYCSIAPNVKIFRANHPISLFTTHPLLYNPIVGYVNKDKLERPGLVVGHDVWIGEAVIILPSVKIIGNGAIIGAGSVVTKDVSPYSIVAGNPAKKVRLRFDSEVIEKLESSKWWILRRDNLIKKIDELDKVTRGCTDI